MSNFLYNFKIQFVRIFLIIVCACGSTYGQTTGDYQTVSTGNWTNLSTWQRWNGSAWATPANIATEGYPGQYNNSQRAYIVNGHNITVDSNISYKAGFTRLEFLTSIGTLSTSLTFASGVALSLNGPVIMENSAGNNTISVGSGSLSCSQIRLENATGSDVSEISISSGTISLTLDNGNYAMNGTAANVIFRCLGDGVLNCKGNILGGTLIAGTGTVNFSRANVQSVGAYTFNNLTLSGSGTKSLNAATVINGNITIAGTAVASLNTGITYNVNSLIFDATGQINGTWGNSSSAAENESDGDFSNTTGILNVAKTTPNFTFNYLSLIYNGYTQGPTVNNSGSGNTYTYIYRNNEGTTYGPTATAPTDVGTYSFTVTVAAHGDCVSRTSAETNFSITKRDLIITGNTTTILRGDTYATTGNTDFTTLGLQNSETIGSVSMSNGSAGDIGTYPTTLFAAVGGTFLDSNYNISYVNGSLTVNPHVGDYWTKTSGNWGTLTTWERWNGTAWVTPTLFEGYPGQNSSPDMVYIQSTHNIIGNVAIGDPYFRLKDMIFLSGVGDSSLTISGSNPIQVNNQVSMLSGGNRTINVGSGFFSVGSLVMTDTGSDSIDSKISVSTGAIFCSGNLTMLGSAARNVVEFTGAGSLNFIIGAATMTGGALIPETGTVAYSSNAAQVVGTYAYYNLTLTTSASQTITCIKTVPATVTIANHFAIDYSASASLYPGTTYNVTTQSLGCRDSEDGTWGSTTSPSGREDDVYFQPTTGIISVAVDTSLKNPVTSDSQPSCSMAVTTGTITVTKQYDTDIYSFDNGATYQTSNIKTGLPPGTYNIYIKNSKFSTRDCTSPVQTVTIITATRNWNGSVNTDWNNAANWTPALVPTSDNCVVISYSAPWRNPTITGNAIAYNLFVKDGAYTIVDEGNTLNVTDIVKVNSGSTLFFRDNASLVQINDAVNTGSIQYKRTTPSLIESDYTYWSSPVVGQKLEISNEYQFGTFYFYDYTIPDWSRLSGTVLMNPAKGYIMRGKKNNNNAYTISAIFTGVPNNGPQSTGTGPSGTSCLIGNPYPSAINANDFLSENITKIEGTLYFWTHKTAIQNRNNSIISGNDEFGNPKAGSGLYAYTSDDYASYNSTGGVSAVSGSSVPNGKITAGQGFFANSLGEGTVSFTNTMRRDESGNSYINSQFFKTNSQKTKKEIALEKHRVWLDLSNSQGAFKQTLVGYITTATNDYDSRFDGESFDGNDFVDFYSINSGKKLVIQGRSLPFSIDDEVPLGFRSSISGEFLIKISQTDGLLSNQTVILEDKLTNTFTNLSKQNYTFNTDIGIFDDRFVLRYSDKTLGVEAIERQSNELLISVKDKEMTINALAETIDTVVIFDLVGRKLLETKKVSSNKLVLNDIVALPQTLIVKTRLQNGQTISHKVIY